MAIRRLWCSLVILAAASAYGGTTTQALSALTTTGPPSCTQTGPTASSCAVGDPLGYTQTPSPLYATATATINAPGVLSVYAFAWGANLNNPADTGGNSGHAIAIASFDYMLEVTGGTGQVLVVPSVGSLSCQAVAGGSGFAAPCITPTVSFSGCAPSLFSGDCLATYGVPFEFSGTATAAAYPDADESYLASASIDEPVSAFRLVDPSEKFNAPGSMLVLPEALPVPDPPTAAPEPTTIGLVTCFAIVGGVLIRRKRRVPTKSVSLQALNDLNLEVTSGLAETFS
jgi:hypothetical protein